MDYKLAKELKEAGFPFPWEDGDGGKFIEHPTLSELIEACGEEFDCLERNTNLMATSEGVVAWAATGSPIVQECPECKLDVFQDRITMGKTPEEAVARLWLKLQKKL